MAGELREVHDAEQSIAVAALLTSTESFLPSQTQKTSALSSHRPQERAQRLSAMADPVLRLEIDLRHRLSKRLQIEQRIIPKTAIATRTVENLSLNCSFTSEQTLFIAARHQNAAIPSPASVRRNIPQPRQQI